MPFEPTRCDGTPFPVISLSRAAQRTMESLSTLLGWIGLIGLFADIVAWLKSREFRKERKRRKQHLTNPENKPTSRGELDEAVSGKEAWLLFLVLTPLLVFVAGLWALFKGWVPF